MMMLRAMETSAAANPMMKRTKICPTVGSGAMNRLTAMIFSEAAEKMISPAINMPMSVRRRIRP